MHPPGCQPSIRAPNQMLFPRLRMACRWPVRHCALDASLGANLSVSVGGFCKLSWDGWALEQDEGAQITLTLAAWHAYKVRKKSCHCLHKWRIAMQCHKKYPTFALLERWTSPLKWGNCSWLVMQTLVLWHVLFPKPPIFAAPSCCLL